jgi:hypothetical protein
MDLRTRIATVSGSGRLKARSSGAETHPVVLKDAPGPSVDELPTT